MLHSQNVKNSKCPKLWSHAGRTVQTQEEVRSNAQFWKIMSRAEIQSPPKSLI